MKIFNPKPLSEIRKEQELDRSLAQKQKELDKKIDDSIITLTMMILSQEDGTGEEIAPPPPMPPMP